ncbi:MAG: ABC transporter ATP-binding protein [Xanthomonadales bacterium]|nr:ABC transporter ATP-binding protein [Xanthomonadales bacterium]
MVFQEPMTSLNPAFTIGEQIGEIVRRHVGLGRRAARARTAEMLDRVGIPLAERKMHAYPHEFSGGMRQRALLAMALSCEPALLIADEPTTALDVTVQAQVLDLIRDLVAETQTSVLFVTHDLGVVAEITDRVVVMYAGQIVESASVDALFARPRHPYTHALMSAMPQLGERTGRLSVIPGAAPNPERTPTGCRFADRCEHAIPACRETPPPLEETDDGRAVRCIRADELILEVRP